MASYLRIVLACTALLLAFAPAHAKQPYVGIYNLGIGASFSTPGEACKAATDMYSNYCPGSAFVVQGLPGLVGNTGRYQ
jgi:hypothetical protein